MKVIVDKNIVTISGNGDLTLIKSDVKLVQTRAPTNVHATVTEFTWVKPKGHCRVIKFINLLPHVWKFCK